MINMHIFGDSFAFGEIEAHTLLKENHELLKHIRSERLNMLTAYPLKKAIVITENMFTETKYYHEYLKLCHENSFLGKLCKKNNINPINHAYPGCGNDYQLYKLFDLITLNKINKNDLIFFSLSSVTRDIGSDFDSLVSNLRPDRKPHAILHLEKINSSTNIKNHTYAYALLYKYFYLLSALSNIANKWKILLINGYLNPFSIVAQLNIDAAIVDIVTLFNTINTNILVGEKYISNTVVDILIDNFGNHDVNQTIEQYYLGRSRVYSKGIDYTLSSGCLTHAAIELQQLCTYFDKASSLDNYKKYFQEVRKHPTIAGNEKIANFLHDYIHENHADYFV